MNLGGCGDDGVRGRDVRCQARREGSSRRGGILGLGGGFRSGVEGRVFCCSGDGEMGGAP